MKGRFIKPREPGSFYSEPNLVTLLRLVLSRAFFVLAILRREEVYDFIGLAIHWGATS